MDLKVFGGYCQTKALSVKKISCMFPAREGNEPSWSSLVSSRSSRTFMYNAMKPSTRKFNVNKDIVHQRSSKSGTDGGKNSQFDKIRSDRTCNIARTGRYTGVCIGLRYPVSTYIVILYPHPSHEIMLRLGVWLVGRRPTRSPFFIFIFRSPALHSLKYLHPRRLRPFSK